MGRLRVRSAALQLRLPVGAEDAAPRVAEVVQQRFIPSVLDKLRQELDSACGKDAVIRIPRLRLQLRIGPTETDGKRLAQQVARDLADEFRASLTHAAPGDTIVTPGAFAQYWPEKTAYLATALISAARDERGPDGLSESVSEIVERLTVEDIAVVAETLSRVEEQAMLPEILASLPTVTVQAILDHVASRLTRRVASRFSERLKSPKPTQPPLEPHSPDATHTTPEIEPSQGEEPDVPQDDAGLQEIEASSEPSPPVKPSEPPRENLAFPTEANTPTPQSDETKPVQPQAPDTPDKGEAPPPTRDAPAATEASKVPPPRRDEATPDDAPASEIASYKTNFGMFPSLLNVALRLELPERLWQIGVPEGAALGSMANVILGDPSDPMVGILAPEHPNPPPSIPAPPGWAREEIVAAIARTAGELTEGAVTASQVEMRRMSLAKDSEWRLSEWGAAALLSVTEALLDTDAGIDLVARLRVPGEIDVTLEEIAVRLPLNAIHLDMRRAGLDRDPGWLGWLQRRMTLHFGSDDEDWSI